MGWRNSTYFGVKFHPSYLPIYLISAISMWSHNSPFKTGRDPPCITGFIAVSHPSCRTVLACLSQSLSMEWHGGPYKTWPYKKMGWVVLSDEQMSKRWTFSLLNDEQMSNKVRVEHQPVGHWGKTTPISGVPRHKGLICLIAGLIKGNQWLIRV